MKEKITSLKKTARVAGMLYLAIVFTSLYAHIYVPLQIWVNGDAAATGNNILANEFLFRACVVVSLVEVIILLFLALVLHRLFKQVNDHLARLMVALAGVQIPIAFVLGAFKLTSLMILKGEVASTFSTAQLPDMAILFLEITRYGGITLELLSGLWLFPFGMLVYRSRFIPRVFGVLLIIAGIGYTVDSFTFMLIPNYHAYTQVAALLFSGIGELSIILWLLIKGLKDHIAIHVVSETKTTVRTSTGKLKEYIEE